jgi:hypothetical protein
MPPTILLCRWNVFTEALPSNDRRIHRFTDSPFIRHGQYKKLPVQQFLYCCVCSFPQERVYQAFAWQYFYFFKIRKVG